MITITLDDPEVERIFYEEYNGNKEAFAAFITQNVVVNNVEYDQDLSYLEEELQSLEANEDCGMDIDEIWKELTNKYAH